MIVRHPAKYFRGALPLFARILEGSRNTLDPFAGVGTLASIKKLGHTGTIYLNDLEPEWLTQAPKGTVLTLEDAEALPYQAGTFDAICTSPAYGNRMADHHNAKDASRRNTYRHALGRELSPGNTGAMQWGEAYRDKHRRIWYECRRVLVDTGIFVLNVKDHVRKGEAMPVTDWHIACLCEIGFELVERHDIATPGNRQGANRAARVPTEAVIVFRKW